LNEVILPVLEMNKPFNIILEVIGDCPHDNKIRHYAGCMPGYLHVYIVSEQPVAIEENSNDQDTEGFEQIKRVPENVSIRSLQLPLQERTNAVVDGKPKAQ
jgi:hypothetical protein